MLKSAVLAGSGERQADYAQAALTDEQGGSPTASYAGRLPRLSPETTQW